jgi:DNA polymerase
MSKSDIFDEIITCMRNSAATDGYVEVSDQTLKEFYSDATGATNSPVAKPEIQAFSEPLISDLKPENFNSKSGTSINTASLDQLFEMVQNCTDCPLHKGRTNTVFGEGDPNARLMFIGEGPGHDEDLQGRPFVGKAGQLLTKMINAMQLTREQVFICNIVKCRPPNNRNPEPLEAETCMPYLRRQIELVKPEVIVLLGAVPLKFLLNMTGILRTRGNWQEVMGIQTMPTLHPAYLLRNPAAKRDAWEDLKQVMRVLGKDPQNR